MSDFNATDLHRMQRGNTLPATAPVRKLLIGVPYTETKQGKAFLHCPVTLGDVERDVYFCVDEEFGQYLCHERADAYLIGLLSLAMRERCDIHCLTPVTSELLHQLRTELIPALTKYDSALYAPRIIAEATDATLPCAGKVGTGCSCGIDSLYAIKNLQNDALFPLDYVTLNNVGAYTVKETSMVRYHDNVANAQAFAKANHLPLIITDSNFADAFPQNHLRTHLFSSTFAIFALRKLWKRYYYASTGCDLNEYFDLVNNHRYDAAKYDLIALNAFSIPSLRICNQGMSAERFEKTKALVSYPPAHQYLNVCLEQGKGNCGHCSKCLRTLWTLDAFNELEAFHNVFDIEEYKKNHPLYMKKLVEAYLSGAGLIEAAYRILIKRIPLRSRLYVWLSFQIKRLSIIRWLRTLKQRKKS